jgi:hypothetical protein
MAYHSEYKIVLGSHNLSAKFLPSENHVNERRSLFHRNFEDEERSLTRETYLSFLFNWVEFNWGIFGGSTSEL